jgi:hypothetical protein
VYYTCFRYQSLDHTNDAKWRVTLDPSESAAD